MKIPSRFLGFILGISAFCGADADEFRLTLPAADVDRAGQIVRFALPSNAPKSPALRDAAGHTLAVQIDPDRTARFVAPRQKSGETLSFTLREGPASQATAVQVVKETKQVRVTVAGQPALFYRMDKEELPRADIKPEYKRAGYLHPVLSPAGKVVTGDYPSNHVHHHGIWSPWTKTKFQGREPDFWNMQSKTGTVEFVAIDRTWNGPVHGGFVSRQHMVDLSAPSPVTALNETWEVTTYAIAGGDGAAPVRLFDLRITQSCATADSLMLPKYYYGGLGYRGPDAWNGPANLDVLTSDGTTDRKKANVTRMRWCYLGGVVDGGGHSGTAILDHPSNFRSPQPVRVHPDMPYLCFVPSEPGDWAIEPGKPYVAQYRFIVVDGAPDRAQLDAYWNGFAKPAEAKIENIP